MTQTLNYRPQDDFYRFINGQWLATHKIPADRPMDGIFNQLHDQSELWEKEIAEDASSGKISGHNAELIAHLYGTFMDEDAVEAAGYSPIAGKLERLRSVSTHLELACLMGTFRYEGIGGLFGSYVGTDAHNSSQHQLDIYQSGISLPDEAYYREEQHRPILKAWETYVATLFTLVGIDEEQASEHAHAVKELETQIASFHRDAVSNRDPLLADHPMTWKELCSSYPSFPWDEWAASAHLPINKVDTLNVSQPDFLEQATQLWAQTDLETLKLWMAHSLIDEYAMLLSSEFIEASFNFHGRALSGTEELRPRWKRGLSLVSSLLGEAMGEIWVSRHFPPENKAIMDELVHSLLEAYHNALSTCDWMGEETRAAALKKLSTFTPKIGYPDRWIDYSPLKVESLSLVDTVEAATRFHVQRRWDKLGGPVDRSEWHMTPQTVNAYYDPTMNEIVFPAAILQAPFFDPKADDASNFGAIGAIIGHEIGHGFDDQGSRFDAEGNLENWWTEEDRARFEERTKRLIEQYDALTPRDLEGEEPPLHVNGALTLGENIGDLAGLSIAWQAYVSRLKEKGETPQTAPAIDGLTAAQRFFTSWARGWRTAIRREFAKQLLSIDPHSPAEFRCNQVVANMDSFAEAYDLAPDDALWIAPNERVRIW
ncbi:MULTISPECIES: M13 family metallopeptidase [unclassified Actinomyces]|uniref:M13 family metallopeptidase n=1 Tax=unclassified Actinomyces TaxID=2609248 RepID=UPI000315B1FA|nr:MULTISPECIES: M13-type metalloendopeptidase [unclassified Actinomyces]MDU2260048.1 M13-type metalloendopeptidase [Actinomyces sp.]MDU5760177.1 M13-type metalloendopeptidase [Actinomyces sp.]